MGDPFFCPFSAFFYNQDKHNRHSMRLADFDYSSNGSYFVTVCAQNREFLFGEIIHDKTELNESGEIVKSSLEWLEKQYEYVQIDTFVIMPNHIHFIINLTDSFKGGSRTAPTKKRKPIGRLIGAFKTTSTQKINERRNSPGATVWQRNYYEHIIRNENDYHGISEYIDQNPCKWNNDEYNPKPVTHSNNQI